MISADPFRLVGGVVTALGFIGAGTIFRPDGQRVEGLTTATSLLFSGAIGVCAALQQWWLAVGATLLALVVLRGLQSLGGANRSEGGPNRNLVLIPVVRYILLPLFQSTSASIHALSLPLMTCEEVR